MSDLHNWIWNHSKLPTAAHLVVLLALAHHSDATGQATVKLSELARMTRLSEDEVRQALRTAIKAKELAITQNWSPRGDRLTNTYRFTVFKPVATPVNGEADIQFEDLPGIPPPKAMDLPKPPQPKIMMDAAQLTTIAADPLYKGLDVTAQAWRFKRWCKAQVPPAEETVRRFKVWLSKV